MVRQTASTHRHDHGEDDYSWADAAREGKVMAELKEVIYSIERCICHVPDACLDCIDVDHPYPTCQNMLLNEAKELLKAQENLKQKMWNALYAEEDKLEKKFIGTEEHGDWFAVYRPWLQRGFEIAIKVIAEQDGM